jgi:hypothetical protein
MKTSELLETTDELLPPVNRIYSGLLRFTGKYSDGDFL